MLMPLHICYVFLIKRANSSSDSGIHEGSGNCFSAHLTYPSFLKAFVTRRQCDLALISN